MSHKYRVLLADDEPIIIESLKVAIPWAELDMEVVGEASNGQEALDAAAALSPDIIISDIRMPIIDGITFMRQVMKKREQEEPIFIVVSGYGEFDYVREALRYGAYDYILKPIDHDELEEIIRRAKQKLDEQISSRLEKERLRYSLLRLNEIAKERLYVEWMEGQASDSIIEIEQDIAALNQPYCLYLVQLDRINSTAAAWSAEERRLWYFALDNVMKEFGNAHGSLAAFPYYSGDWVLMFPDMGNEEKKALGVELVNAIKVSTKLPCIIGISRYGVGLNQLRHAYGSAVNALHQRFVHPEEILFIDGITQQEESNAANELRYPVELEKKLLDSMKMLDIQGLEAALRTIYNHLESIGTTKERTKRILFEMTIVAERQLEYMMPVIVDDGDLPHVLEQLETAATLQGSIDSMYEHFSTCIRKALNDNQGEASEELIHKAKMYVEANYQKDIGVETVAEFVQMSYSHFCTLFKQVSGYTFLEYLTRLRIEKACFILKHSDVKVFQIAPLVGYQDPRYFTQVFKKVKGMTPTEYRES